MMSLASRLDHLDDLGFLVVHVQVQGVELAVAAVVEQVGGTGTLQRGGGSFFLLDLCVHHGDVVDQARIVRTLGQHFFAGQWPGRTARR